MIPVLNKRVMDCRKSLGWSQDRLAKEAGVSQSRVSRIERGWEVYASEVMKLSEVFLVPFADLMDASKPFLPQAKEE